MLCAISGEAPQVPVASRKSGHVFEKRLIEAYIAEHGKDPVTGEELSVDDLIELKNARTVRPRPPTLTSIPSLLAAFQNEWDALVLESYTLKQQLAQTRQELSTALYQHDAALRVIARLGKERDEARDALSKIAISAGSSTGNGDAMQVDTHGVPEAIAEKINTTQQKLSSTRRKRPIPEGWATADTIQGFEPLESTGPLYPGSRALALNKSGDLVLFGGANGEAGVYSVSQKQIIHALKCGNGSITDALWWDSRAVVATSTGDIKIFEDGKEFAQLGSHPGSVTSLSLHPCGDILASTGLDKSYQLHDLTTMKLVTQILTDSELTCSEFHPDGHLFAVGGNDGQIKVFTTNDGENALNYDTEGPLQALTFSENGIWLATVSKGQNTVSIWDLRKSTVIKDIDIGNSIESVRWDYTGQFLAIASSSSLVVQHYSKSSKSWSEQLRRAVAAIAVQWGPQAESVILLNTEGGLAIWGPS